MFEAWTLRQDSVKAEEEKLREDVRLLDDPDRAKYFHAYNKRLKDPDTYAVLNYFFIAGLHHFYLGKYVRGSINLLILLSGMLLFPIIEEAVILILGILLVEIPALFRSQIIVADHNTRLGQRILASQSALIGSEKQINAENNA